MRQALRAVLCSPVVPVGYQDRLRTVKGMLKYCMICCRFRMDDDFCTVLTPLGTMIFRHISTQGLGQIECKAKLSSMRRQVS